MIEDKLTPFERIRLECLAQANAVRGHNETAEAVIERASKYAKYVSTGETFRQGEK